MRLAFERDGTTAGTTSAWIPTRRQPWLVLDPLFVLDPEILFERGEV